jgi:hypothetical protein
MHLFELSGCRLKRIALNCYLIDFQIDFTVSNNKKLQTKHSEPRTMNSEPPTKNKELRTPNKEQRTKN